MRISDWSSDVCSSDLRPVEHAAGEVEAVGAAVERTGRFVEPGLGWEQVDRSRGDIGRVGEEYVDPPSQVVGKRLVEVALVHLSPAGEVVAHPGDRLDRKSAVQGKTVAGRVDTGVSRS